MESTTLRVFVGVIAAGFVLQTLVIVACTIIVMKTVKATRKKLDAILDNVNEISGGLRDTSKKVSGSATWVAPIAAVATAFAKFMDNRRKKK
jgi:hypothetical protein